MRLKLLLTAVLFVTTFISQAQSKDEQQIRSLLQTQVEAWNRGDLEAFMQTYWKSDSLMFIGKNGIKWGWDETLANYKKGYPDTAAMGKLSFNIIQVKRLSVMYYYVVGK